MSSSWERLGDNPSRNLGVRTRFYQTLLAFSALGTAGIGIQAHTSFDEFEPLEYGAEQNARIEAYGPLVRETARLGSVYNSTPEAFRKVAQKWVSGMESGELRPLAPIAHEDDLSVPAKQQIVAANGGMVTGLNMNAAMALADGDFSDAAVDAILAFKTANVLKYSDFDTVGAMSLQQRKSVKLLNETLPYISEAQRTNAVRAIVGAWEVHPGLSRIAQTSRRQYVNYLRRMGNPVSPLEENDRQVRYYENLSEEVDTGDVIDGMKLDQIRRLDPDSSSYIADLRFSYSNEHSLEREIDALLQTAQSLKKAK